MCRGLRRLRGGSHPAAGDEYAVEKHWLGHDLDADRHACKEAKGPIRYMAYPVRGDTCGRGTRAGGRGEAPTAAAIEALSTSRRLQIEVIERDRGRQDVLLRS